ncbi:MAG: hypothetical protein R3Y68_07935 [Rikenellaceae bacterium]
MNKFLLRAVLFLSPFIVYALYILCDLAYISANQTGDLEGLGGFSISNSREYHKQMFNPKLDQVYFDTFYLDSTYRDVKVLNVGDSFSNQGVTGYVNFMAKNISGNVLNISANMCNPFEVALGALNSGMLSAAGCKVVVVQSVGRYLPYRFATMRDETEFNLEELISYHNSEVNKPKLVSTNKIQQTYEKLLNLAMLKLSESPVRTVKLNADLFSSEPRTLHYYYEDISICTSLSDEQLDDIASKADYLRGRFRENNIEFIILAVPDKYDLYQNNIVENKCAPKVILDQIQSRLSDDFFINAKDILLPMIENGVKDVYLTNDTHWSQIAAETVGVYLAKSIGDRQAIIEQ